MLFVAFIAMIVLGPEKLPEMARKLGQIMGELRRVSDGFQQELRQAIDDTSGTTTVREVMHGSDDAPSGSAEPASAHEPTEGDEPAGIVARGPAVDDTAVPSDES